MKYYAVIEISRATAANDTFSGSVAVYFHGRAGRTIGSDASGSYAQYCSATPCDGWRVAENAYRRRCDAVKNWSFKNPENSGHWESFARVVEITADTPESAADMLNELAHLIIYSADALQNDGTWEKLQGYKDKLIHRPVA